MAGSSGPGATAVRSAWSRTWSTGSGQRGVQHGRARVDVRPERGLAAGGGVGRPEQRGAEAAHGAGAGDAEPGGLAQRPGRQAAAEARRPARRRPVQARDDGGGVVRSDGARPAPARCPRLGAGEDVEQVADRRGGAPRRPAAAPARRSGRRSARPSRRASRRGPARAASPTRPRRGRPTAGRCVPSAHSSNAGVGSQTGSAAPLSATSPAVVRDLDGERGRGLVDLQRRRQPPQVADAEAARAQHRGRWRPAQLAAPRAAPAPRPAGRPRRRRPPRCRPPAPPAGRARGSGGGVSSGARCTRPPRSASPISRGRTTCPGSLTASRPCAEQPLDRRGRGAGADRAVGVAHAADRRAPGQPVEQLAGAGRRAESSRVASVPASDRCSETRRSASTGSAVGARPRSCSSSSSRCGERRSSASASGGPSPRGGRRACPARRGRAAATRGGPPRQGERAQGRELRRRGRAEAAPDLGRARRLGQHREHLEHLQRGGVEPVDGALHAEPSGRGGGERRDVGRQRDGEVRTPRQEVGEGVVVPSAQVVGQAPRRGRPSGGCGVDHLPTVRGPAARGARFGRGRRARATSRRANGAVPWSSSIIGRVDLPRAPRS